jgi:hypothetical protein
MRIGKWKISFKNIWGTKELTWLYRWQFKFVLFAVYMTDLVGQVAICNFVIRWEKMFK